MEPMKESARNFDVKYYGTFGPNYRHYEEFNDGGNTVRVTFNRETKIAKNVPERIAIKLHNSEAFDIVGADGKVPAEFAEKASPHGKPKQKIDVPPQPDVKALQDENLELKRQIAELHKMQISTSADASGKGAKAKA